MRRGNQRWKPRFGSLNKHRLSLAPSTTLGNIRQPIGWRNDTRWLPSSLCSYVRFLSDDNVRGTEENKRSVFLWGQLEQKSPSPFLQSSEVLFCLISNNMSIAALLQAAEFLERRERGKLFVILYLISSDFRSLYIWFRMFQGCVESADFDRTHAWVLMFLCCLILDAILFLIWFSCIFRSWTWLRFFDAYTNRDHP